MSTVTKPILLDETGRAMADALEAIVDNIIYVKGDTGATGPQGIQGIQGPPGADGLTVSVKVNGETISQVGGNINIGTVLRPNPQTELPSSGVLAVNTQYYLGELATLTIELPTDATLGQQITIVFSSGEEGCNLVHDISGLNFVPQANKTNKLVFTLIDATTGSEKWIVETEES